MTTYTASPYDEIKRLNKEVAHFKQLWQDEFKKGIQQGVKINLLQMQIDTAAPTQQDAFALQSALDNVIYYQEEYLRVAEENNALKAEIVALRKTQSKSQYQSACAALKVLGIKPENRRKETIYRLLSDRMMVYREGEWTTC